MKSEPLQELLHRCRKHEFKFYFDGRKCPLCRLMNENHIGKPARRTYADISLACLSANEIAGGFRLSRAGIFRS